jgi:PEP-CTERM motif
VSNGASGGGGSTVVGGSGAAFANITTPGAFSSTFSEPATTSALAALIGGQAAGEIDFSLAGSPIELWQLQFTGAFSDDATVTLHFDPSALGSTPLADLEIEHFEDGQWVIPPDQVINPAADTITFETDGFSPFVLATVPEPPALLLAMIGLVGIAALRLGRLA